MIDILIIETYIWLSFLSESDHIFCFRKKINSYLICLLTKNEIHNFVLQFFRLRYVSIIDKNVDMHLYILKKGKGIYWSPI